MSKLIRTLASICLLAAAFPSHAIFRAYLSLAGNDANPCTLGSPCRTIGPALTAVDDGGEIWMVDSANYNTGTIVVSKSVTIQGLPGAIGSILSVNGPAFSVTTQAVNLVLRNLVIKGVANFGSTSGVIFAPGNAAFASLVIDKCQVADMPSNGVEVSGATSLLITDSTFSNNGNIGVYAHDGAIGTITRATMVRNGTGLRVGAPTSSASVSVRDSIIANSTGTGLIAVAGAIGAIATLEISGSQITGNRQFGFQVNTGASGNVNATLTGNLVANNTSHGMDLNSANSTVILNDNIITGNGNFGINWNGANILTASNNIVKLNSGAFDANVAGTTFTKY